MHFIMNFMHCNASVHNMYFLVCLFRFRLIMTGIVVIVYAALKKCNLLEAFWSPKCVLNNHYYSLILPGAVRLGIK